MANSARSHSRESLDQFSRIDIVDRLRGLVIVLMILDHVREYLHVQALVSQPTDASQTTVALFATRWITHLCAPTFVFLSGVSIGLQHRGSTDTRTLSRFLATRGAWLIALELTVVALALDFRLPFVLLQVIWAIGAGMVVMALLVHFPRWVGPTIGIVWLAGYQALVGLVPADKGAWQLLWTLLVQPGPIPGGYGFVAYPLLPWFAFMAIGYGATPLFTHPRNSGVSFATTGLVLLAVFALLRALNGYGDFRPWQVQAEDWRTVLSFLDVSKYPPSLDFALVTLGVSLSIAPLLARLRGYPGELLGALGRASLMVYILHLYMVHAIALVIGVAIGLPASYFVGFLSDSSRLISSGWGFSLVVVYLVWLAIVLALYPLARRYSTIKAAAGHGSWMRYI